MSKFKLMLNGLLRYPLTIESLSHHVRSGDVIGKLDVHWGRNSFRENQLKAKVKSVKSFTIMSLYKRANSALEIVLMTCYINRCFTSLYVRQCKKRLSFTHVT